jgi:ribosomal protein S25
VALEGEPQAIANVAKAAAKAEAELCGQLLRTLDENGAIKRVAQAGTTQAIANVANAAAKAEPEVCEQVLRTLGENGAIRRVAQEGEPQHIANMANAAAKAEALCGQVLRTLDENGAIKRVALEGEPQAIANVANAAAKAEAALCGQVLRTLEENGAIDKVAREGKPQEIANVANAAAKADAALFERVLRTLDENGAIDKVAREGKPQEIANMANAAAKADTSQLAELISTTLRKQGAFGRLGECPDAVHMDLAPCVYLAGRAGDAEAYRQLVGSDKDPNKAIQHHTLAGLLARAEAGPDALATFGSRDLMGMLKVAADSLNVDGLRQRMRSEAIVRDDNGSSMIDLHDLTHPAALQTLSSCLEDLPRGASLTVITGQGLHRQDGQNPMADIVRAMCADKAVAVTLDPANPGRMTVGEQSKTLSSNVSGPSTSFASASPPPAPEPVRGAPPRISMPGPSSQGRGAR